MAREGTKEAAKEGGSKKTQDRLREAGLRITQPRLQVLGVLRKVQHISAESVYKILLDQGDEISVGTIYRVLADLEQAGLVERQTFQDTHAVYELSKRDHHDHLICLDCGRVMEFLDPVIEERQDKVAAEHGLEVVDHTMHLYGRCTRENCTHRENS